MLSLFLDEEATIIEGGLLNLSSIPCKSFSFAKPAII